MEMRFENCEPIFLDFLNIVNFVDCFMAGQSPDYGGWIVVYFSWKLFCVVNFWLFSVRILRHSQCGATEAFDKRPKVMLLSEIIPGLWLDDDKGGSLLVIIVLFLSFPCRRRVSCSSINICTSVIVQQQYIF